MGGRVHRIKPVAMAPQPLGEVTGATAKRARHARRSEATASAPRRNEPPVDVSIAAEVQRDRIVRHAELPGLPGRS